MDYYKVRGSDGKEYGPALRAEITGWLREGRMTLETEVKRSDLFRGFQAGRLLRGGA